ncbi:MAG: TlpA family protein disulfide reductase [Psychroserpens sp.]|nr:TlpA family protein disulfide reductase [Psychroserpens sp.]MBO6630674.1 TlpA family protein disulfide reductase [Psychroserpens sp.]MBO6652730.1 TlpA family protein disulfide reductase [Psychroserpens sp.]MBO6681498.1 TlpA family protein disulfide reductase [Psychroserpens sp.]MBO6749273.1 TlpA family protein disulfide reductase [Psychroserpens sp.]
MKTLYSLSLTLFMTSILIAQDVLPKMQVETLDGDNIELSSISENDQLVVVSLWATWCVPCKNELDAISEVYDDWVDETNVKLYAISVDDARTVKRVRPLVSGKGWEFDILLDTNSDLKRQLNAPTIPVTLLVKNNKILFRHSGYTPGSEDELYEKIKEFSK